MPFMIVVASSIRLCTFEMFMREGNSCDKRRNAAVSASLRLPPASHTMQERENVCFLTQACMRLEVETSEQHWCPRVVPRV